MIKCKVCGKKIGFFNLLRNSLCNSCNEKRQQAEEKRRQVEEKAEEMRQQAKEHFEKLLEIMKNLGYKLINGNYGYGSTVRNTDFVKINRNGKIVSKVHSETLLKGLWEKGYQEGDITGGKVQEILDFEDELNKIKEREKKFKLKEEVEKSYYGKVKTKRLTLKENEKETILRKFGNKCSLCDNTEGLHIHHKDKNPKNNRIDNLIVLCGICHKKIHMKVR